METEKEKEKEKDKKKEKEMKQKKKKKKVESESDKIFRNIYMMWLRIKKHNRNFNLFTSHNFYQNRYIHIFIVLVLVVSSTGWGVYVFQKF